MNAASHVIEVSRLKTSESLKSYVRKQRQRHRHASQSPDRRRQPDPAAWRSCTLTPCTAGPGPQWGPHPNADTSRPGPEPLVRKEAPSPPGSSHFSSGRRSSWSLRSSSSTRWPKGSEEMDTILDRMTLLSLLPVRTSWSCEWL